jgi:hypothetical protein
VGLQIQEERRLSLLAGCEQRVQAYLAVPTTLAAANASDKEPRGRNQQHNDTVQPFSKTQTLAFRF